MKKKILIVGGYEKAISLTKSLVKKGYQISIINKDYNSCVEMAKIKGINVYHGDGTKLYVLEDSNIENNDIVISLIPSDEDNLVVCELAKKKFGIKKTISLVSDPCKIDFFYEMGIDSVVCAISAVTKILENQTIIEKMINIGPIGNGLIQLLELNISSVSPVLGKEIKDIGFPEGAIIGAIIRKDYVLVPNGSTKIQENDTLILISSNNQLDIIKNIIGDDAFENTI